MNGKCVVKESNRRMGVFDTIIFGRRDMKSVSIPLHIKVINNYAFEYCNIHTVTFESNSSLELVKYDAFNYIPGPERLVLPPSLKEIRDHSFSNIKNIKSLNSLANLSKRKQTAFVHAQIYQLSLFQMLKRSLLMLMQCQKRQKI